MGKKSRRNNKKEKEALIRKAGQTASAQAAANSISSSLYNKTVGGPVFALFLDGKVDELLKIESEYGHLETFSNDPVEEFHTLFAFGAAHTTAIDSSEERNWDFHTDRSIQYFERAREIEHSSINDEHWKSTLVMNLAPLYARRGRDMEKAISTYRWFLANSNRDDARAVYHFHLSQSFHRFKKYEYAIEVLEGRMGILEADEELLLVDAFIGYNEMLKAKALIGKTQPSPSNTLAFCFL